MSAMKFYILSLEHTRGGVACWWAPDSRGYVEDLQRAGVYTLEEAKKIVVTRSRRPGDLPPEIAIPIDAQIKVRHVVDLYSQGEKFENFVKRYEDALPCYSDAVSTEEPKAEELKGATIVDLEAALKRSLGLRK